MVTILNIVLVVLIFLLLDMIIGTTVGWLKNSHDRVLPAFMVLMLVMSILVVTITGLTPEKMTTIIILVSLLLLGDRLRVVLGMLRDKRKV